MADLPVTSTLDNADVLAGLDEIASRSESAADRVESAAGRIGTAIAAAFAAGIEAADQYFDHIEERAREDLSLEAVQSRLQLDDAQQAAAVLDFAALAERDVTDIFGATEAFNERLNDPDLAEGFRRDFATLGVDIAQDRRLTGLARIQRVLDIGAAADTPAEEAALSRVFGSEDSAALLELAQVQRRGVGPGQLAFLYQQGAVGPDEGDLDVAFRRRTDEIIGSRLRGDFDRTGFGGAVAGFRSGVGGAVGLVPLVGDDVREGVEGAVDLGIRVSEQRGAARVREDLRTIRVEIVNGELRADIDEGISTGEVGGRGSRYRRPR